MATKRFCDIDGCGQEVTDYKQSGYVKIGAQQVKVLIELQSEVEDLDICADCFWKAVKGLDKRPTFLTAVAPTRKRKRGGDRNAL